MKTSLVKIAAVSILAWGLYACSDQTENPTDEPREGVLEGIALHMEGLQAAATMSRANVGGLTYVVNTASDPTRTRDGNGFITGRNSWNLDMELYNGAAAVTPYAPGSFTGGVYNVTEGYWGPATGTLYYPNYLTPYGAMWLYPDTRSAAVEKSQSGTGILLAQDILYSSKSLMPVIAHKITAELRHMRAMLNFRIDDVIVADIDQPSVRVWVGTDEYTPYNASVVTNDYLEFMLILPENTATTELYVTYQTVATAIQQPSEYRHRVTLNNGSALGSNNCYCFSLSGTRMEISPVTVLEWSTGEPVSGEYVAVTAYPTFKGMVGKTFYFYYDNELTEPDGTGGRKPLLQRVNFNNDGEATIKPDGRVITHIFSSNAYTDDPRFKLASPIIIGGQDQKMYIDITSVLLGIP